MIIREADRNGTQIAASGLRGARFCAHCDGVLCSGISPNPCWHIAMSHARTFIIAAAGMIVFASGTVRSDETVPQCTLRLNITLSLEVEDATDPAFLSSLVGNHAAYRIFVRQKLDSNHIVADVFGPGPAYRCKEVLDAMNRDARVNSIQVVQSSSSP